MADRSVKGEQKGVSCPLEKFSRRAQESSILRVLFSGIYKDRNPLTKVIQKVRSFFCCNMLGIFLITRLSKA